MRLRRLEEEFAGRLRVGRRAFALVPEDRADRTFRDYHRAHRQAAAAQGEDAPRFEIPEAGARYPRSSLPALEAAIWARETHPDRFPAFDLALFEAFFSRTEDISDPAVLARVGAGCGIDRDALAEALDSHRYAGWVRREDEEARHLGLRGVPAVLIPGAPPIVGAVPYPDLERAVGAALQTAHGRRPSGEG